MQHKIVVLNSELVDYDNQIDFHALGVQVTIYRHSQADQILERVNGYEIVVTKELTLPASLIAQFPASV